MRILVSAEGTDLESPLGVNFARCRYYLVVDTEAMTCEAVANPWVLARAAAGSHAADLAAGQEVDAVVTGLIGPNAFAGLDAAGIPVFSAPRGTVRLAVQAYRAAHLLPLAGPNAAPQAPFARADLAHARLGSRRPGAARRGGGRAERQPEGDAAQEIVRLRARARALDEEMAAVQARIEDLTEQLNR